jgi:hypothetical protein
MSAQGTLLPVVNGSYRESEFRDLNGGFPAANFEGAMSLVCPILPVTFLRNGHSTSSPTFEISGVARSHHAASGGLMG